MVEIIPLLGLIVLLFSIMIHEIAHGSAALALGDPTAKYAGRLTLNPLKHIDPVGTIILPLLLMIVGSPFIIGWAKPVPVNPYNFKDQKWGNLKVAAAGPAVNFLLAFIFGLAIRFLPLPGTVEAVFGIVVLYNFVLGTFNLIPIPPLDGSHIFFTFFREKFNNFKIFLQRYSIFILIAFLMLGGLNLVFRGAMFFYSFVTGQTFSF
jgi:Zn-dependent protease